MLKINSLFPSGVNILVCLIGNETGTYNISSGDKNAIKTDKAGKDK